MKMKMERPRSRNTTRPPQAAIPSDDDSAVSWDELNDAVNIARRQSVQSLSSNDASRLRNNKPLPTIYASGNSTRDFSNGLNNNDSSGNIDFDPQVV